MLSQVVNVSSKLCSPVWRCGSTLKESGALPNLTQKDIESAQKSISKALDAAASDKSQQRGKYNSYSPEQHAELGKYVAENGPTCAAKDFTAVWSIPINESTARRLKSEYVNKLKEEISKQHSQDASAGEPIIITTLETKCRGRPVLLGAELDGLVQEFVLDLRMAGGVVNTLIVMGAAEGIVSHCDISKLSSHGGHIEDKKTWKKSLLLRMGFVKRKCLTSAKISLVQFDESKEVFLAKVLMKDIPENLIINWDQTGLSIVPTGDWTMEKEGTQAVPIAHSNDKRQLTAVLAITAGDNNLPAQLLYQGKTPKCHPEMLFPEGWDVWHSENHWSNESTMKRYIDKIIVPKREKS